MWGRVCGSGRVLLILVGAARHCGRPRSRTQKLFSTSSALSTTKDGSTASTESTTKVASQDDAVETPKQKLLKMIGNMKVEVTTKRKFQQLKEQEIKKQDSNKQERRDRESSTFQNTAEDIESFRNFHRMEGLVEGSDVLSGPVNFHDSNVISEMAVKKQSPAQRSMRVSNLMSLDMDEDGQRIKPGKPSSRSFDSGRSLKAGRRLNIFTKASPETENAMKTESLPTIWDLEFAKEIAAVTEQPPRNGFEEMIQWTEDGIMWEFPIDNEAGMDDGAEFHEHIFLEKHLKDFPKQGPIRHFMELVICGLSKNPFLSVKQKIEHIEWFRNYFEEKKEYLQGTWESA
ncbi:hypothetical protein ASZ78_005777 [Callipepla squamata]|uniref:Small ribosomal subunit protein mS31 n=1 Tax=Callipepla squamata TaxID=9009 RepID=A0A226MUF2_CALSU|nr:hypothetical protein ASZ78_005777 [Callipepla squamata]